MYNQMPERNIAPPHIPSKWQKQLTDLLGLNPYGEPKLRLVWGQEARVFRHEEMQLRYRRCREGVFDGWYEYGPGEDGQVIWLAHHPPAVTPPTIPDGHTLEERGSWQTIGVDRWFIEQWKGPKTYAGDAILWEAGRYKYLFDPSRGIQRKVDVFGPYPHRGGYVRSPYLYPWMIARHERVFEGRIACCDEREEQGLACFGEYRQPEQRDIDYIAYLIAEKNQEPYKHGYDEAAPAEVVAQDIRDATTEEGDASPFVQNPSTNPIYFDMRRN
jgi:hypothetical protein